MTLIIKNIKCLVHAGNSPKSIARGDEMSKLDTLSDAYLIAGNGIIKDLGPMSDYCCQPDASDTVIDASGKFVFPSFCDSHTHLVYAGSREQEFSDRKIGRAHV